MLSLSYTLASQYVARLAVTRGLDLAIGFLHETEPGRPALVLDLLEPVRPAIDQWVWKCLREQRFTPQDFRTSPLEGCRLGKEARGQYFAYWTQQEHELLNRPARRGLARVLAHLRPGYGVPTQFEESPLAP